MPCYYAGSLNDSGVTVNECARDSGLKSRSANNAGSMHFVTVVHDFGRRLNQSRFRFLAPVSSANTTEKRPLQAGKEETSLSADFSKEGKSCLCDTCPFPVSKETDSLCLVVAMVHASKQILLKLKWIHWLYLVVTVYFFLRSKN